MATHWRFDKHQLGKKREIYDNSKKFLSKKEEYPAGHSQKRH